MLRSLFLSILLALGLSVVAARPGHCEEVTVFAAASLKTALDEITTSGGLQARLVYGGSSSLARQIEQGAPAQVFISANSEWMDVLDKGGLLASGSRRDLLTNRLALIAPAESRVALRLVPGADLAGALGPDGRLAMGLTEAVPAGIYGRAALDALGLWDSVAGRTAQTDDVRAALHLVALGETPLGIVYVSDAVAEPRVRVVDTFDASLHPPIVYPAAIVAEGDTAAARAFLEYLDGPEARGIFAAQGFGFPDGGG